MTSVTVVKKSTIKPKVRARLKAKEMDPEDVKQDDTIKPSDVEPSVDVKQNDVKQDDIQQPKSKSSDVKPTQLSKVNLTECWNRCYESYTKNSDYKNICRRMCKQAMNTSCNENTLNGFLFEMYYAFIKDHVGGGRGLPWNCVPIKFKKEYGLPLEDYGIDFVDFDGKRCWL
jgi:hypothetical protein